MDEIKDVVPEAEEDHIEAVFQTLWAAAISFIVKSTIRLPLVCRYEWSSELGTWAQLLDKVEPIFEK